ncbi:MAG: aldehyde dehydrogenase family protein [Bilophila wadsworthia]
METCEAAIATAAEAYKTWRLVPIAKRMTYIHKIRECMIRDLEKLAQGIALDQAKHISEARGEVQRVIEIVEMACSIPALIQGETLDRSPGACRKGHETILGVFGGVAPFNFPALVFGWFIPFAIGTGNTFIYKPSPSRPTSCSSCAKSSWKSGLPGGVVSVIPAAATSPARGMKIPASRACARQVHPDRQKWPKAAPEAPRILLLGGAKNMLVVMEDADIDVFIENYINSCYGSAGQRCLAGSIVAIVPELYDTVLERMIEAAKKVKVGDALDPDVYMGPLISRSAADKVKEYVDIALNHGHGCELVLDGRNPELPEKNKNGYFVGPTIIKDVTPCNPLFTTEVFGPLVATIKIADIDDALELIRQSEFGNGACIFTQSQFYAEKFSRDADVGMVGVNVGICAPHPYIPFGGIKGSLLGTNKAQGKDGIDFFTQNKVTTIRTVDPNAKKGGDAAKPKSVRSCVAS